MIYKHTMGLVCTFFNLRFRGLNSMSDRKKLLVIFGGASSEHEVSGRSATAILNHISRDRYDVLTIGITKEGKWYLYSGDVQRIFDGSWKEDPSLLPAYLVPDTSVHGIVIQTPEGLKTERIDVIFPVLHGKNGEDGTIQGLFTMSGIPYVGCDTISSAICMDKAVAHSLLMSAGIEQAHYLWFYADRYINNPEGAEKIRLKVDARLKYPIFVKPANAGSSVGISKVHSIGELDAAVEKAAREDRKIVVEEGIVGQEVECAVLGNRDAEASVVGEIGASAEFYDYDDKYVNGTSQLYIPARIPESTMEEIRKTAVRAYRLLGCSGLARVDFFVTEPEGTVILNEINTLPGFTSISMYPKLWEATGLPFEDLTEKLIELAFQKH